VFYWQWDVLGCGGTSRLLLFSDICRTISPILHCNARDPRCHLKMLPKRSEEEEDEVHSFGKRISELKKISSVTFDFFILHFLKILNNGSRLSPEIRIFGF